jgi:hypothetical protein
MNKLVTDTLSKPKMLTVLSRTQLQVGVHDLPDVRSDIQCVAP